MARRTISTVDGQTFSDRCGRFEDRKGHILYKAGAFDTLRINKRNITTDDVSGMPASMAMFGAAALAGILLIAAVSLNRVVENGNENAKIQTYADITTTPSPIVIASTKSGLYYLPECPEYFQVKPQMKSASVLSSFTISLAPFLPPPTISHPTAA